METTTIKKDTSWVISDITRELLHRCELFQDLTRNQLMAVAALVEEEVVQPEQLLLREGEPSTHFYVITRGRGVAQLSMHRGWLSLGLVNPGDAAGWSSLVEGTVYPATVKALTRMQVAKIDAKGLRLLMSVEPAISSAINKRLSALFCRQYQAALETFKISG